MIPRYSVPEISALWNETARFQRMLTVEIALLRALEQKKIVPAGTAKAFESVKINPERIREIEAQTRHDVIAFCTSITEQVDPTSARYFHFGVTSSDVLDTALSLQLRDSIRIIVADFEKLLGALDRQIEKTKDLLCLGRSHGMAAEPMVFAQKFLSSRAELARRLRDYQHVLSSEITGQISGAVGNYTILTPEIEKLTLDELQLPVEEVSTQVIPRDHLGLMISIGALTASAIERLATELRLLHHSDISEVHEGFKAGQKGSSTMPHKKNPVSSENLSGLARVIRSHLDIALENIVLWHERDISHSSTERLYLPDHFGLLSYSLKRLADTVEHLEVHREHIENKVKEKFTTLSSFLLHEWITQNPEATREEGYAIVQEASFEAKNLEEMMKLTREKSERKNRKADFSALDWNAIKQNYFRNFEIVRKRTVI